MKPLLFSLLTVLILASCSKDKTPSETNNLGGVSVSGVLNYSGTFSPTAGITVSGQAKIYLSATQNTLLLDNFSVSGGPDLKVYLSKADSPTEFINLGALKSLTGNQSYIIPQNINFSVYKYALIHCQRYNHLFAIAELKP